MCCYFRLSNVTHWCGQEMCETAIECVHRETLQKIVRNISCYSLQKR